MLAHGFDHRTANQWQSVGERFVHDDAHGVNVTSLIELVSLALLRRHVHGTSAHFAHLGKSLMILRCRDVFHDLSNAEVHHFDEVFIAVVTDQNDIARLEISVNNSLLVRVTKRFCRLHEQLERPVYLDLTFLSYDVGQRHALEVVHDDIRLTRLLRNTEIINRDDVRVIELTSMSTFLLEPFYAHRVAEMVRLQHFDCDNPVHDVLATFVDYAHSACAQVFENLVFACQLSPKQRILSHRYEHAVVVRTRCDDTGVFAVALETVLPVEIVV